MILVDTSALAKLLVEEAESSPLRDFLTSRATTGEDFAISTIGVAELRRLAIRLGVAAERVEPVVGPFRILRLTEGILQLAGRLPHRNLGTLDALHLATALTAEMTAIVTYDKRLGEASTAEGLTVLHPGAA